MRRIPLIASTIGALCACSPLFAQEAEPSPFKVGLPALLDPLKRIPSVSYPSVEVPPF